jgi:ABC-2 type transport system permease protein
VAVLTAPRQPELSGAGGAHEPNAWHFVRLKLRLLRNGFRGQPWRVLALTAGVLFGLFTAGLAMLGLIASAAASVEVGRMVAVYAGAAAVLGWTLLPLLFFGVDETLDPARFALLPLRRALLVRGMFAAAFVGVPAVATLIALSGLVVAAGLRSGAVVAGVALLGVAAGLALGVVASRAVTSAFAALLRSRRVRDLAILVIALLASSIGPLQLLIQGAALRSDVAQAARVAGILAWTPLGAPYALPFDVAGGRWADAGARLAITAGAIGLLVWWWSRTIESAMLASSTGGGQRSRPNGARSEGTGAAAALVPWTVRGMVRPSVSGGIVAADLRFWWRDPRRRAGLVSILMSTVVLALVLNIAAQPSPGSSGATPGLMFGFVVSMSGVLSGLLLANQFAYEGSAYAAHLLAQVPGRVQVRARAVAIGIVVAPVQILVVVAVSLLARVPDQLGDGWPSRMTQLMPTGLGMLAGAFGVSVAAAGVLSVLAAYPLPETSNPFALNTGGAGAKGLLAVVAMVGTLILCLPIVLAALFLSGTAVGPWLLLVGGIAYGGAAAWLGTIIAGDLIDRRGPELLAAVTPRR